MSQPKSLRFSRFQGIPSVWHTLHHLFLQPATSSRTNSYPSLYTSTPFRCHSTHVLIKHTGKYDKVSQKFFEIVNDWFHVAVLRSRYSKGFGVFHSSFSHEIATFIREPYLDLGNWQWKKISLKHKALCFPQSTLLSWKIKYRVL